VQEKRKIVLGDKVIEYTLDRGKRKNTYICISQGELIVRIPARLSLKNAENIILEKKDWILSKLSKSTCFQINISFEEFSEIYIFGQAYTIEIIHNSKKNHVEIVGDKLFVYISRGEVQTIIQNYLDEIFKRKLQDSLEKYSKLTGLYPEKVTPKKLNRSWGLCSSKRSISINKKLVHYPDVVTDYVVLHELCHLKYMNHSKEFWDMVERFMPDYKEIRRIIK
jgi:predicted metal-dependent hydrolase